MFPRIFHFIWDQGFQEAPERLRIAVDRWASLNPEWEVRKWDGELIRALIASEYRWLLETWDALDKPVMRSDLGRMVLAHKYGGVYLDMDLEPVLPIKTFLGSGVIYNKRHRGGILPDRPSEDYCDLGSYELILSRENCQIDQVGSGVANGVIIAKPDSGIIRQFMVAQKDCYKGLVLDFMGTWALARFVRSRIEMLKDRLCIIPPHYFLWEETMKSEIQPYTISIHPAINSWGDPTKKDWWRV